MGAFKKIFILSYWLYFGAGGGRRGRDGLFLCSDVRLMVNKSEGGGGRGKGRGGCHRQQSCQCRRCTNQLKSIMQAEMKKGKYKRVKISQSFISKRQQLEIVLILTRNPLMVLR